MTNPPAAPVPFPGRPKPVLAVRDLVTHFPTRAGLVKAVDGVSFKVERGKTLCVVGESGSGKSVTARSILQIVDSPGRIVSGEMVLNRADGSSVDLAKLHPRSRAIRRVRGREIAMIFQEPMSLAVADPHGRRPDHGGAAPASRHEQGRGPGADDRAPEAGRDPAAGTGDRPLHLRVLRRHAPARHDRHGAGLQPAAADRRRADHGAGRHHPGRDPRPDQAAAGRIRHGGAVHHP